VSWERSAGIFWLPATLDLLEVLAGAVRAAREYHLAAV
jgi:hypothetical protein